MPPQEPTATRDIHACRSRTRSCAPDARAWRRPRPARPRCSSVPGGSVRRSRRPQRSRRRSSRSGRRPRPACRGRRFRWRSLWAFSTRGEAAFSWVLGADGRPNGKYFKSKIIFGQARPGSAAAGLKVRRHGDFDHLDVARMPELGMADAWRPGDARAPSQSDPAPAPVLQLDPTLEHIHHLEPEAMMVALRLRAMPGSAPDHVRQHFAACRPRDAEIPVLEKSSKTGGPEIPGSEMRDVKPVRGATRPGRHCRSGRAGPGHDHTCRDGAEPATILQSNRLPCKWAIRARMINGLFMATG